jgi:nucleotide-binding universal stress UspA family protein
VALEAAAALFPEAALTLVHSYHAAYEAWISPEDSEEGIGREAAADMARFLDGLDPAVRTRIDPKLVAGEMHSAIERAMLDNRFDLLVLGTHGRGGFAHATIGSRASELLAFTSADVMMVRMTRPAG